MTCHPAHFITEKGKGRASVSNVHISFQMKSRVQNLFTVQLFTDCIVIQFLTEEGFHIRSDIRCVCVC